MLGGGGQWLFSESSQQTLPVKRAHHLELGQDQGQGAIDSARKAPHSRGDGLKVARSREKDGLLGKALNNPSERFRLSVLPSPLDTFAEPFAVIMGLLGVGGPSPLGQSVLPHPVLANG